MKFFSIFLVFCIIIGFVAMAQSEQVLIWDNDNGSHYTDENQDVLDCEVGLESALEENNIDYITLQSLPDDLSEYAIIFVELGLYCEG